MDVIRLRTLTTKSRLGFGQYADMTIDQIIAIKKKIYLVWVYFNINGISFTDDILDAFFYDKKWLIDKPGTNPKMFEEYINRYKSKIHGVEGLAVKQKNKKRSKARYISKQASRHTETKKSVLQARNQGR